MGALTDALQRVVIVQKKKPNIKQTAKKNLALNENAHTHPDCLVHAKKKVIVGKKASHDSTKQASQLFDPNLFRRCAVAHRSLMTSNDFSRGAQRVANSGRIKTGVEHRRLTVTHPHTRIHKPCPPYRCVSIASQKYTSTNGGGFPERCAFHVHFRCVSLWTDRRLYLEQRKKKRINVEIKVYHIVMTTKANSFDRPFFSATATATLLDQSGPVGRLHSNPNHSHTVSEAAPKSVCPLVGS